jgi:hypothetical protein
VAGVEPHRALRAKRKRPIAALRFTSSSDAKAIKASGARISAKRSEDHLAADGAAEPGERVRQVDAVLVAKLGGREATLDHRHQGLPVLRLEGEFGLELEARSVEPGFGRVEEEATRPGRRTT